MPLRKRVIDIPLIGGLNTKTSDKNLAPPEFLELKNIRFKKNGKLEKKLGYTNLGQTINTGTLNTPTALGSIRDELLMLSQDRLYSRSVTDSKWYDKGPITATSTEITKITASPTDSEAVDVIVQDGVKVATWLEGTTIYYSVFDQNTGATIVEKATLATSAGSIYPRLASLSGNIYIFHNSSSDLVYTRIPTSTPASTSTGNLYTTMDSGGMFDVDSEGDHLYVMFKLTGASTIRISKVDSELSVVATNTITSEDPQSYKSTAILAFNSTDQGEDVIFLAWENGSNQLRATAYDTNLVQKFSPVTVDSGVTYGKTIIAIDDTTQSQVKVIFDKENGTVWKYETGARSVDMSGSLGTEIEFGSIGVASRACYHNNVSYFNVLHENTLQATYFTMTTNGRIVAKFAPGEAGTHATTKRPSNFSSLDANTYTWGALKKGRVQSENATLFADRSPHFADLSFDAAKAFVATTMHDDYVIAGGIPLSYDGETTTEYGFHLAPETVTAVGDSNGDSVPNGTYLVYVIYEWTDKRGVRFQSAPSVATSVTTTGGEDSILVTYPNLRLTDKSPDVAHTSRENVKIRIFVTENGGTVPYFSTVATNSVGTATSIARITADPATLTSNEILYTSGGALDNEAPPSCSHIFTHNNRPICVGTEDKNQVRFGKELRGLTGVGFNLDFAINVDPIGGDLVAGASMDDYMILFKETAIMAISGSGPNDLGQASDYSTPQLVSSDIGCKDPKSVLQMPDGIIFKSEKGIYLLTRSLELLYIGDKVEDFNSDTIKSSDILKDANEIRFVTNNNVTLVYNYYFKRWSVFDTVGALDATIWQNNKYVYLTSSKVMQEDSTTYLDDGSYVQSKIRTGWIHLAGLQGFQRVYKMAMLGTYHNNHVFQIKHYFDYSETPQDTVNVTAATLVNTSTYGDSATYGDDSYYGGSQDNEVYQMREDLPRQKCQSISFEFVDSIVGSNNGQGFSMEGITLLIGVKSGLARTSATRSV